MTDLRKFTPKPPLWRRFRESLDIVPDSFLQAIGFSFVVGFSLWLVMLVFFYFGWNTLVGVAVWAVVSLAILIVRWTRLDKRL